MKWLQHQYAQTDEKSDVFKYFIANYNECGLSRFVCSFSWLIFISSDVHLSTEHNGFSRIQIEVSYLERENEWLY